MPPLPLISTKPLPTYSPPPPVAANTSVDALYVHVPFCSTKCHYCDFYSIAGHLDQSDAYLDALAREMDLQIAHFGRPAPQTIFIGGGTPTLIEPRQLHRLLTLIRRNIDPSRLTEFTVEANPNTFDLVRAQTLVAGGVNRISFGAQSFHKSELQTLQRDHDPENVPRAVAIARQAGVTNLNIDLIFGIPGQTLESWEFSLASALALSPDHMSCYSLIYEPNTPMTARLNRGDFSPIDEELELTLFNHVYTRLRAAGFERYEVSNYGQPGRQCRHNLHYWKASPWLGWGPAAGAHVGGYRWKNVGSLSHYLEALNVSTPTLPLTEMEHLNPVAWAGEVAAFWLRLSDGLNYSEFSIRTSVHPRPALERVLKKYADLALVELTPTHARITEAGVVVSNRILRDVLSAFTTDRP